MGMMEKVKDLYPELYTKQGKLRKTGVNKYVCECGHSFNGLKTTRAYGGLKWGMPVCSKCGKQGKKNKVYGIWKRLIKGDIEKEDFLMDEVKRDKRVEREELLKRLEREYPTDDSERYKRSEVLGYLVYFRYLKVEKDEDTIYYVLGERDNENREEFIW